MQVGEYALDLALRYFGKKGIFPSSQETTGAFFTRARYLISLAQTTHLPSSFKSAASTLVGGWPDWILIEKTRVGLAFFERGATFIGGADNKIPAQIHLKELREDSPLDKEVWLHELVHALRYQEEQNSCFEEPIAYFFSPSFFRKWLGATFRRPLYHWLFLLSTLFPPLLLLLLPLASLTHAAALWLPSLFLLLFNMACSIKDTKTLKYCFSHLVSVVGKEKARSILIRLSDHEIKSLSKQDLNHVVAWCKTRVKHSLKWRQIALQLVPSFLY